MSMMVLTVLVSAETIAEAALSFEEGGRLAGKLGPQAADVNVHGPLAAFKIDTPDQIQQTGAAEELATMSCKEL